MMNATATQALPRVPIQDLFGQVLQAAVKNNASDVHMMAGAPFKLRIQDKLLPLGSQALTPQDTKAVAVHILAKSGRIRPEQAQAGVDDSLVKEVDCSYGVAGLGRFRVNICFQRGSVAITMRRIPFNIPTVEQLKLPPVINEIALESRGLVIVTGMTGSGKSTTLASMVDYINGTKPCKIITIEDPIEFLYRDKQGSIIQREVGSDTEGFVPALRASLRQDPDVILVGEMRDEETVEIAIKAAETGHLVLTTLHTTDAAKTLNRLISFVPPEEEPILRLRLGDALLAIISQRLLPRADGKGLVAAVEILRTTASIKDCILNPEKTGSIVDFMRRGRDQYKMQTFDQHLMDLKNDGIISTETALGAATCAADFERSLVYE